MNVQRSRFQCRIFVDFGTAVGGGFCYTGEAGKHKFREDELDMETKQKEEKDWFTIDRIDLDTVILSEYRH